MRMLGFIIVYVIIMTFLVMAWESRAQAKEVCFESEVVCKVLEYQRKNFDVTRKNEDLFKGFSVKRLEKSQFESIGLVESRKGFLFKVKKQF